MGFFIYIVLSAATASFSEDNIKNNAVKEINKTKNILNRDIDLFHKEFLSGDNSGKTISNATDGIINKIQTVGEKKRG